jgi:hypothetical protein
MHSDIEGACRYYLRYRLADGRRVYDPVGKSSAEALAAANRKEIELFAALRGAEIGKPDAPRVAPSRVKVDNAIVTRGHYGFATPFSAVDFHHLLSTGLTGAPSRRFSFSEKLPT